MYRNNAKCRHLPMAKTIDPTTSMSLKNTGSATYNKLFIYTVSQKRDPDIIDCNFKRD